MFAWLDLKLNPVVYVRVERDAFVLLHVQSRERRKFSSATPFANARLAVADFSVAESLLKKSLAGVLPQGIFRVSPTVVMHQCHLAEGGLSPVEERALHELGLGAGARKVYLWQGAELGVDQLLSKVYMPLAVRR